MGLSTIFILSVFFSCTIANTLKPISASKTVTTLNSSPVTTLNSSPVTTLNSSPVTTKQSAAVVTSPPPLNFYCIDGKVKDIDGSGIDRNAVVVDIGNGKMCHISQGKNCTWQDKYTKLYVIYDKTETNAQVVAGHPYYYELECKSGYVAKAQAVPFQIGSTEPTYIHKDFEPTNKPGITVELYKEQSKKLTSADRVYIGDKLSLKIKGPVLGQVSISPINCTASNGNNEYLLWNNSNCKSNDEAIMENNWTNGANSISINMYAFRFVDSSSVTIECSAYICPLSDGNCTTSVITCPNNKKKASRRRRSSNTESNSLNKYKEETSSVSFTVVDRFDGTNGSEDVFGNILLYLTSALITILFLGRE